jgi:hypothetical protein
MLRFINDMVPSRKREALDIQLMEVIEEQTTVSSARGDGFSRVANQTNETSSKKQQCVPNQASSIILPAVKRIFSRHTGNLPPIPSNFTSKAA